MICQQISGSSNVTKHQNLTTVCQTVISNISVLLKNIFRASLVVQWLRISLPMQGTRVQALVWEDPTCRGATRPVSHNY